MARFDTGRYQEGNNRYSSFDIFFIGSSSGIIVDIIAVIVIIMIMIGSGGCGL